MNSPRITPTPQSLFGDLDLDFAEPGLSETSAAEATVAPQPIKTKTQKNQPNKTQAHKSQAAPTAAALAGQAFLPGLSRRGRPRLQTPISAVERTAEHRRKRLEAGAKRLEMILDRDVSTALDALAEHLKEPRSEVISTLILMAASRVLKR